MTLGRSSAVALIGLEGILVSIEADVAAGLPRFAVVGLPDRALTEATDRVRSAIVNSGLAMPSQRVTVNLSPASLPKTGTGFDLGIAMAALAATGQVPPISVSEAVHIGELALDGRLRPTPGVLPAVMGAAAAGASVVVVPKGNRDEAGLVPGIRVVALSSLREVAIWHGAPLDPIEVSSLVAPRSPEVKVPGGDLDEVIGNRDAISALIVAAAGGHHLSMVGPPGAGKTMLATRLVGILPTLSPAEALDVACIQSVEGSIPVSSLPTRRPFEAPHHSATTTALIGGGSGVIRPGSIARAAHGVLFLDEAPEFSVSTLDSLRQPLEAGHITIHRAGLTASFPAKFMLVLAANPCPCGQFGVKGADCVCPPSSRRRYMAKLSGPLRDRIDIHLALDRVRHMHATDDEPTLSSAQARVRVVQARACAQERWQSSEFVLNADVPGSLLRSPKFRPATASLKALDSALARGLITARGYDRTLRLAWTLADLEGANSPQLDHIGRALLLRRGAHA
jgi:magnesium chelatase family protein